MVKDSIWKRWEVMTLLFIVVVSLVIAGGYAAYGALSTYQESAGSGPVVTLGDTVSVDYIGMFEDGTVFDTSLQSVAENHTLYPKSLSFSSQPPFNPLSFTVGEGQMIEGFDRGVIGMGVNQTRLITIPPEEGYGQPNPNLIKTRPLTESVPVYEWMKNSTEFQNIYSVAPHVGTTVISHEYGWKMNVYYVDPASQQILVKHAPTVGEIVSIAGTWDTKVISIDTNANGGEGEIVFRHQVYPEDVGMISGEDFNGQFIVSDVDLSEGTFSLDYNREVVGKTLVFKVTVVSIGTTAVEPS